MRTWLIHLCGGYTKKQYEEAASQSRQEGFATGAAFIAKHIRNAADSGQPLQIEGVEYRVRQV